MLTTSKKTGPVPVTNEISEAEKCSRNAQKKQALNTKALSAAFTPHGCDHRAAKQYADNQKHAKGNALQYETLLAIYLRQINGKRDSHAVDGEDPPIAMRHHMLPPVREAELVPQQSVANVVGAILISVAV